MRKIFLSLCTCVALGFASEQVQIVAKDAQKNGNVVKASNGVILYYDEYVVEADSIVYDTLTQGVELSGNVLFYKGDTLQAKSDKASLNLTSKDVELSPLMMVEQKTNIWLKGESACKKGEFFTITNSYVSSCNAKNPDWKIQYSSAEFDTQKEWFESYNNIFYLGDIPIFYLPYFGLPTSKTRRSGLLFPKVSYSNDYGLSYMQPIYFAPRDDLDVEFNPQVKSGKGIGSYATLRFADTPTSKGVIKTGYFSTLQNYYKDEQLKNRDFFGYEVLYERDSLFDSYFSNYTDTLLIDGTWLNDIGYVNQQYNEIQKSDDYGTRDSNLITSTINYALSDEKHYFGLNSKMFIDVSKVSNSDTFQMLPSLNYHIFKDSLLHENILYSLDLKATNFTRRDGFTFQQYEFDLPIGLSWSFFDDFLGLSISENLYGVYLDYDDMSIPLSNWSLVNNYHKLSLFTNLSKEYDSLFHNFNVYADYVIPSFENEKGTIALDGGLPVFSKPAVNEHIALRLEQFFYTHQDIQISHFLAQKIHLDDYTYKYGDLENEIRIEFGNNFAFESIFLYSHEESKISESIHTLSYFDTLNKFSISHAFSDTVDKGKSNFIDISYGRMVSFRDELYTRSQYNIRDDFAKLVEIGWIYRSDCWSSKLSIKQERIPKSISSGSDVIDNKGIYFEISLLPFGEALKFKEEKY